MNTQERDPVVARSTDEELAEPRQIGATTIAVSLSLCSVGMRHVGQVLLDTALQLAFQRIQSGLRNSDVCRALSPNLITVVLPTVEFEELSRRLIDLLHRAYIVKGQTVFLNAHMGVALASPTEDDATIALAQARIALKHAEQGAPRTIVCYTSEMEENLKARDELGTDIRKALALRQFEVHYQPQIDLHTRKLIGLEALLRWRHPSRGWISPVEFIPLAEDIGMISVLGAWVLKTACRQATLLPEGIVMAVNASPIQLINSSLLDSVHSALAATRLPAGRLEVEITEGILLESSPSIRATLNALDTMGVRLAIDDFGTGYSSLAN